jgi:hypothetical protein
MNLIINNKKGADKALLLFNNYGIRMEEEQSSGINKNAIK